MHLPKFDLFVFSRKITNVIENMRSEEIMVKLYRMFQYRLNEQGFGNAVYDTECYQVLDDLTPEEIDLLKHEPFFISEHYLSKDIAMCVEYTTKSIFRAPWRSRPSMDAYTYANRGKAPLFHVMVVGSVCSGKTYVMNEFKLMLRDISEEIEIIECDNGIKDPDNWDISTDPEAYAGYKDRVKNKGILIAGGPRFRVGIDDQIYHNTKI